jgi:hypothetical protein
MSDKQLSADLVTEYAATKLEDHLAQIRRCVGLLNREQLWRRVNAHSNSVANLLLHLNGNVRQWVIGGLAGREIVRDRQTEFDARDGAASGTAGENAGDGTGAAMVAALHGTLREACGVIRGMEEAHLAWDYVIQGYHVSGAAAVMHVLEHFAFHTGQIVTMTKAMLDVDLSLYDEHGHRRDGRSDETP